MNDDVRRIFALKTEKGIEFPFGDDALANELFVSVMQDRYLSEADNLDEPAIPFADLDEETRDQIQASCPELLSPGVKVNVVRKDSKPFAYRFEDADGNSKTNLFALPGRQQPGDDDKPTGGPRP